MNICLVSTDFELKTALDNTGYFDKVNIVENLEGTQEYDILVVSDQVLNSNDLVMNDYPVFKGRKVYYMLSNYNSRRAMENMASICKAKGINVIPPKLSLNQIVERIVLDLFPDSIQNSNVIALFGTDSKVGTTMVAQSLAETLAANTNAKVLLMFLNGHRGTSFIKDDIPDIGIDNIKVKLINQILTKEDLTDNCIEKDNLYILPGVDSILDIRHFHPEHIESLINLASQVANIIIIDCGNAASIDFAGSLSISGLNAGRYKYLVTSQLSSSYDVFKRANEQILKILDIKPEDFLLIVNKYYKSTGIPTPDELCKKYETNLAGALPYLDFKGWESDFEKNTLLGNGEFKGVIEDIAKITAEQLKIRYIEKQVKKSFLQNLFKK